MAGDGATSAACAKRRTEREKLLALDGRCCPGCRDTCRSCAPRWVPPALASARGGLWGSWLEPMEHSPSPVPEEGNRSGTARASHSGTTNVASANAHRRRAPMEEPPPATQVMNSGPKVLLRGPRGTQRDALPRQGGWRAAILGRTASGPQKPSSWRVPSSPSPPPGRRTLLRCMWASRRGFWQHRSPHHVPTEWGESSPLPGCTAGPHQNPLGRESGE